MNNINVSEYQANIDAAREEAFFRGMSAYDKSKVTDGYFQSDLEALDYYNMKNTPVEGVGVVGDMEFTSGHVMAAMEDCAIFCRDQFDGWVELSTALSEDMPSDIYYYYCMIRVNRPGMKSLWVYAPHVSFDSIEEEYWDIELRLRAA